VSRLEKRRVIKEDGRYLIFYSFKARPESAGGDPKPVGESGAFPPCGGWAGELMRPASRCEAPGPPAAPGPTPSPVPNPTPGPTPGATPGATPDPSGGAASRPRAKEA